MPKEGSEMEEQRELTMLVYVASDNPLAPLVVSEIKAIKDAGFQKNTTVLVYFDPMEKGAPTQLLDVNHKRRKKEEDDAIGDGADPFVRNMIEDQVDPAELTPAMLEALETTTPAVAFDSLKSFINFGLEKRTAKNYMLILLGHGMIVANDTFLPDDDSHSAVTLKQLRELCGMFTNDNKTSLRLLGLHSCSMSSIEVAYELKGKADYMLATQGTMFVNGWPYRQLLKKTLNQVKRAKKNKEPVDYDELVGKLYKLCLFNFTDFMTAGYSCDIALCRLHPENFERLKGRLQELVSALKQGLAPGSIVKNLILLAHWDAQSFWSENYTDLWDFCACLAKRCDEARTGLVSLETGSKEELATISKLCKAVQDVLASEDPRGNPERIVRNADNFGTEYQFARGLSVYFPWCRPIDDRRATVSSQQVFVEQIQRQATRTTVLQNYEAYDFTQELGDHTWFSFLERYWDQTKRAPRIEPGKTYWDIIRVDLKLSEQAAETVFRRAETTFNNGAKRTAELKKSPDVGTDCTCPTIKNYPTERNLRQFSITPTALRAFLPREGESVDPDDE